MARYGDAVDNVLSGFDRKLVGWCGEKRGSGVYYIWSVCQMCR